jgi:AraC-like DNA-binding protein
MSLIIIVNIVCIVFLTTMLSILAAATRMKGGAGWAAVIIITTMTPLFLANMMRDIASEYFLFYWYPATVLTLLLFPALWFFTQSQMDKSFRLTRRSVIHFIPALISLVSSIIYYAPLSAEQVKDELIFMQAGGQNLPQNINDIILLVISIPYTILIIRYIRKRTGYLKDNFSDSGYIEIRWTPRFLAVYFGGFFIGFVIYAINPRTDTWLIPILNMVAMIYLVYCVIFHSTTDYMNRLPNEKEKIGEAEETGEIGKNGIRGGLNEAQMKEICEKVMNYLTTSHAYTNSDFSLAMLAAGTGTTTKKISSSINGYLKKNFYDLINEMRIEEVKKRITAHGEKNKIDSISVDCGFRSRSAFYVAFKKAEGITPTQWMKTV